MSARHPAHPTPLCEMDTDITPPSGGFLLPGETAGDDLDSTAGTRPVLIIYSHGERHEWIINARQEKPSSTIYTVTLVGADLVGADLRVRPSSTRPLTPRKD